MIIVEKTPEFNISHLLTAQGHDFHGAAVAIGKFDGLHLGHQKIIAELMKDAKEGLATVVFTFDPSPMSFFSGRKIPELATRDEKRRLFEAAGVDVLIEFPLTAETAATPPVTFVEKILVEAIGAKKIVAGRDVTFGDRGMGDYKLLESMEEACGYKTVLIDKLLFRGREISSTYVRDEIAMGHMEQAKELLGRPYTVSGVVEYGKQLGRTIGFPTINIVPEAGKLLPPNGVYYSDVRLEGSVYHGMTNIGVKPTVKGDGVLNVETYLYDYEGDAYGAFVEVALLSFKRSEMKFNSVDDLKRQMKEDIAAGRLMW